MAIQFTPPLKAVSPVEKPKAPNPPVEKPPVMERLAKAVAETKKASKFRTDKKTRITFWIDNDILERLRSEGPDWQPRISSILRERLWSK